MFLFCREKVPSKMPRRVYSQVDENGVPIPGVDELSTVGHPEDVEVAHVFEKSGEFKMFAFYGAGGEFVSYVSRDW